jgi:hypothetical protein
MSQTKEIDVGGLIEDQKFSWFRASIIVWSCTVMHIEGYDMQEIAYAACSITLAWQINKAYFGPRCWAGCSGGVMVSVGPSNSLIFSCAAVSALCCSGALYLFGEMPEAVARGRHAWAVPQPRGSGPSPSVSSNQLRQGCWNG